MLSEVLQHAAVMRGNLCLVSGGLSMNRCKAITFCISSVNIDLILSMKYIFTRLADLKRFDNMTVD